ncbi:ArnT family glycosyltransferase [Thermosulfuriphilus sp.]
MFDFLNIRSLVGLFILFLVLALAFQGSRGLFDCDETRYAEVAREMLISGQFLIPQRDFLPHLTKPP